MKNYGFIKPEITPDNYVLGSSNSLPKVVLEADANWTAYLPSTERQNINIETFNCTGFGTLNCLEVLCRKIYGEKDNFSDRFMGIMAGTNPPGNDPQIVAEAARHEGVIPESLLPFSGDSWQEYYSFKGANEANCRVQGQQFLNKYSIGHEYVFNNNVPKDKKLNLMREALKYSPLGIAVYAWQTNAKGEYVREGEPNHWTMAYKIDDQGHIYVFDSYAPYYKTLSADHEIMYAKRYNLSLNPNPPTNPYLPILEELVSILKDLLKKVHAKVTGVFKSDSFSVGLDFSQEQPEQ